MEGAPARCLGRARDEPEGERGLPDAEGSRVGLLLVARRAGPANGLLVQRSIALGRMCAWRGEEAPHSWQEAFSYAAAMRVERGAYGECVASVWRCGDYDPNSPTTR